MYKPKFNSVLIEIDDNDAKWGGENNENMLGKSYTKGRIVEVGEFVPTNDYPLNPDGMDAAYELVNRMVSKDIMWNEGTEAGTTFEEDGKLYGFIYWWDIRAMKEDK